MKVFPFIIVLFLGPALLRAQEPVTFTPAGSFTLDGNACLQGSDAISTGMAFSDVRFGGKYSLGPRWKGEIVFGFTRQQLSFREIYLRHLSEDGNAFIQVGHFAEPFGLEYIESPPFNRFITPSAPSQLFAAKRKVGIQYARWTPSVWFSAGLFADGNLAKTALHGPQGYAVTGRMLLNPWRETGRILHMGVSGTWRRADGNGTEDRSVSFSSNGENGVEKTAFLDVTVPYASSLQKAGLEGLCSFGRFSAQGELFGVRVLRFREDLPVCPAWGGYVQAGFLLTGDRGYTYDVSQARLLMCRPGTLELTGRFSYADLDDEALSGGMFSGLTVGANWYIQSFLRLRLAYGRIHTDAHSAAGEGVRRSFCAQIMIMFD